MILYTANQGVYKRYEDSIKDARDKKHKVYINLTNRCTCACTFCLRNTKELNKDNNLWLEKEPTASEVIAELERQDMQNFAEVIICGFGEPTMALEVLLEVTAYLKKRDCSIPIRLNTNGLAELEYKKEIAPLFKGLIDTVSISFNASNAEEYFRVTQSKFGIVSYDAMLNFAIKCKAYVPHVVLSVVDIIGEAEIAKCQAICDKIGVKLRVRPFE